MFTRTEAFAPFTAELRLLNSDILLEHAQQVAALAVAIVQEETQSDALSEKTYLAGLLHDVGVFALFERYPQYYARILELAVERKSPFWQEEFSVIETTHALVGAYLLGLWGLDDEIVRTVAHHHQPSRSDDTEFTMLTAVHVADALCRDGCTGLLRQQSWLDDVYLERLGLTHRVPVWEAICENATCIEALP